MSSLEIAQRTGKRPADVMRDIRSMLQGLGIDERSFASVYRDAKGEERPCYHLPKRECLILVSGYSVELRAAIIDRWQELEAQAAPRIPTHVEALRLAADAIERAQQEEGQKLIAQARVAELEPVQRPEEHIMNMQVSLPALVVTEVEGGSSGARHRPRQGARDCADHEHRHDH